MMPPRLTTYGVASRTFIHSSCPPTCSSRMRTFSNLAYSRSHASLTCRYFSRSKQSREVPAVARQSLSPGTALPVSMGTRSFTRFYTAMSGYQNMLQRAYVALGSNLGDRLQNIETACRALRANKDIVLMRTSGLWQTQAMYMTDQNDFLNAVCEVRRTVTLEDAGRLIFAR